MSSPISCLCLGLISPLAVTQPRSHTVLPCRRTSRHHLGKVTQYWLTQCRGRWPREHLERRLNSWRVPSRKPRSLAALRQPAAQGMRQGAGATGLVAHFAAKRTVRCRCGPDPDPPASWPQAAHSVATSATAPAAAAICKFVSPYSVTIGNNGNDEQE